MEFLKEILGEELFAQFKKAIDAYNGDEANTQKVKLANLASGEYVGKGKFDGIQALLDGKTTELESANGLIAELKKSAKGNDEMQGKITGYEQQVATLQAQLEQTKKDYALRFALQEAGASDVEYAMFKLKEKHPEIRLDESGNISGWNDLLSGLKTQLPSQFGTAGTGEKKFEEKKLPEDDGKETLTREEILRKPYEQRAALYEQNPEAYNTAMKK